jgi:hypothetical protein
VKPFNPQQDILDVLEIIKVLAAGRLHKAKHMAETMSQAISRRNPYVTSTERVCEGNRREAQEQNPAEAANGSAGLDPAAEPGT